MGTSIRNRLTAVTLALTAGFVAVIGLLSYVFTSSLILQGVEAQLRNEAELAAQRMELSLNAMTRDLKGLSENSLIVNSLVDAQQRSAYLGPFMRDHHLPIDVPATLTLIDSRGNALTTARGGTPDPKLWAAWFPRLIETGRPHTAIQSDAAGTRLLIAYPVRLAAGGPTGGALVLDIGLEKMFASYVAFFEGAMEKCLVRLPAPERRETGNKTEAQARTVLVCLSSLEHGDAIVAVRRLALAEALRPLGLAVELRRDRIEWIGPLIAVGLAYMGVGVIAMLLAAWLSRVMVRQLTAPLERLSGIADQVAAKGWGNVVLPEAGEDEVGRLSASIRKMLAALQSSQDQLEEQVGQRTRDLKEAQSRLSTVLNNVDDGIISIDENGNIESFNQGAERMFGYSAQEVLGKRVDILAPTPGVGADEEYLHRSSWEATDREGLFGVPREVARRRQDGSVFPAELTVNEVQLEGRRLFVGLLRDITERKRNERLKNEFISTVSHELRTPLTSIRGALGLVGAGVGGALSEQSKSLIDIAYRNSERLSNLINDLLDIERIESGKMSLTLQRCRLMPLILQAVEANAAYASQFGVRVVVTKGNDEAGQEIWAEVDADRLMQVMANLISNAVKFSPKGEQVEIAVESLEGRIRVAVIDRGPGIPEEFRAHIFEKFSQADASDTRQKGGTGLGLSITKHIVEAMAGEIDFDTTVGGGATMYFDLPVAMLSRREGVIQAAISPVARQPRVLVCEDDPDIAALITKVLRNGGFEADIANDAAQAWARIGERVYMAMTLDLGLPGKDGIALLKELRANEATRELPIVVVSASAKEGHARINGVFSIVDWLDKPINHDRLRQTLSRLSGGQAAFKPRVLHVEDDAGIRGLVAALAGHMVDFDFAASLEEAREKLARERYHLVMIDLGLPDGSGWDLLPVLGADHPESAVLVFSASDSGVEEAKKLYYALLHSQTSNLELLGTISRIAHRGVSTS